MTVAVRNRIPPAKLVSLALVVYLAPFLVWTSPVLCGLWVPGDHPARHQAHRVELERLGVLDHHLHSQGASAEGTTSDFLMHVAEPPTILSSQPAFGLPLSLMQLALGAILGSLLIAMAVSRLSPSGRLVPGIYTLAPPEPPPRP